ESKPAKWLSLPWVDIYSGEQYGISTGTTAGGERIARVKTYGDVLDEYEYHPEAKSVDALGNPCGRSTKGLLQRRPILALRPALLGKESKRLDDVQAGIVHDSDEAYTEYRDDAATIRELRRALDRLPLGTIARQAGVSVRWLSEVVNGRGE